MTEKASKLINLRWGYDGGGIACGPVEGNTITEATFVNSKGKIFFVSVSRMSEFANVYVSETSLYDLLLYLTRDDVNLATALKQVEGYAKEKYELELIDLEEIKKSKHLEEIKVVLIANDHYYHMDESADAAEWMKNYNEGTMDLTWESDYSFDDEDFYA